MVNVRKDACEGKTEDKLCGKIATFAYPEEKRPRRCADCMEPGMLDVKNKLCEWPGCRTHANYGFRDVLGTRFCSRHKEIGMVGKHSKLCHVADCSHTAVYGYENDKVRRSCVFHRESGMQFLIDARKPCRQEKFVCGATANPKYDGYCRHCFGNLFPDDARARDYMTKERLVRASIREMFPQFAGQWICDKKIADGCSCRRPDMLLQLEDYFVIVEIDENQHEQYDAGCENARMMEISRDIGHRPAFFIRFNPDSYVAADANLVRCSWVHNSRTGNVEVHKKYAQEWNRRLAELHTCLQTCIKDGPPSKMVEVIHLFFDA